VFLLGLTFSAVVLAVRERVVIRGDDVEVIRLFSVDTFTRSDVSRVVQSGGRGRPAHVVLVHEASTNSRSLDLTGRPRLTRAIGFVRLPALMTARRLADAIDAPLMTYTGEPTGEPFPKNMIENVRTPKGRIRPLMYAYGLLLIILGALLAMLIASGS
jgi:hypothetical protein